MTSRLYLACIAAVCVVHADAEDSMPMIQFSIKPRHCVLSYGEKVCRDELEITWMSRYRRSLCLYRSDNEAAIKCWENAFSGTHHLEISASHNVDFQLRASEDETPLISEAFEVVQDTAKFRRRRKNAWSFF